MSVTVPAFAVDAVMKKGILDGSVQTMFFVNNDDILFIVQELKELGYLDYEIIKKEEDVGVSLMVVQNKKPKKQTHQFLI